MFLTLTLGFSVWLFSESELPGIFFFFFLFCSSPLIVSGPSLASPLLFLSYLSRTLLSAPSPQHRALPGRVCLVCYHQQFTGTSSWMDPASAIFLQTCWNLPHLEACKAPSHFCHSSRNSLPCFLGINDNNLVVLSLVLLSWLLCFIGKFREIKKLNCHYYLILRMAFSLSTANWHLPSTSTRIKSCAAAATDLQYP